MSCKNIYLYVLYFCYQFFDKYKYSRRVLRSIVANKKHYYKYKHDSKYEVVGIDARKIFPHNALWSTPRSGNHWVRFIVEYLTGHPTCGHDLNARDRPIFTDRFPSIFHPLAHVSGKHPYILYKSHTPYSLLNDSTIILLVRDINELIVRYAHSGKFAKENVEEQLREYTKLIKVYNEFSGAKLLIYYEDLLLNPEKEILRMKHFLGASDSRYKDFMDHHDYYAYLSRHPLMRRWSIFRSGLNFNFYRARSPEEKHSLIKEGTQFFYQLLAKPEYQKVKPYIARYM